MTYSFARGRLGSAVSRAASCLGAAGWLVASPAQAVLVTTYNTGTTTPVPNSVLLTPGAVDGNYSRVVSPLGGTGGVPLGATAVSVTVPANRLPAGGVSGWIGPAFNYNGTVPPVFSTSYYQTSFDLTGLNLASAAFSGRFATDDPLGRVYLNGVDLSAAGGAYLPSAPNTWASFYFIGASPQSTLVAGLNYLTFEVARAPSPIFNGAGALRVEWSGDAVPLPVPEPSTYALMALGLAGIGVIRRRSQP